MKRLLLFLIVVISALSVLAGNGAVSERNLEQTDTTPRPRDGIMSAVTPPDSLDVARLSHKAFWRASAEVVGMNLSLWAFDRYVQKGHYAYISWRTIKENFKHGFEWDDDHLSTNMFAHPYNGSIFYNAGRSNGYNFWQSSLFGLGGSAMWEMFMEREYPSTNDIIATPVGGAAIGEVLYRSSDLIIDDRSTGFERFGRELAAFVVDPMRGFTRIVTGRAWQHRATSGRRFGIPPITVKTSLGLRLITFHADNNSTKAGAAIGIDIEYGDRFADRSMTPYDWFSLRTELQLMKTQPPLGRIEIVGRLMSKELGEGKFGQISLGMFQHFDYFDSDTISVPKPPADPFDIFNACSVPYKLGTPASVGAGIQFRLTPPRNDWKWRIDGYAHANWLALAGVLTDFYRKYHRNYNWGMGYSLKVNLDWQTLDDRWHTSAGWQFYKVFTWVNDYAYRDWSTTPGGKPANVVDDNAYVDFHHLELSVDMRILPRTYLTVAFDWYHRLSKYHFEPHGLNWIGTPMVASNQAAFRLMLTYKL